MKEEKFTKILGEINEDYIAEVYSAEKEKRVIPFKKWVAIAACVCLLAASGIIVIAEIVGIRFLGNSEETNQTPYGTDYTSYVYKIEDPDPVLLPRSVFGERFHELEERLSKVTNFHGGCFKCLKNAPDSCEHHKVYGYYGTVFYDGPSEAAELIGYEKLIVPKLDYEHKSTNLYVSGNKDELSINKVSMSSAYLHEGIFVEIIAEMCLENPFIQSRYVSGFGFNVPVKSEEEYFILDNGEQCLMVKTTPIDSEDILITSYLRESSMDFTFRYDGYILKDGVFYFIAVSGNPGGEEKAAEIFSHVMNCF